MLDKVRSQALVEKILGMSQADDMTVNLSTARRQHLRFANNQVTTSGMDWDQSISVSVSFGSRTGSASANQLDDASIRQVVQTAESLAKVAPEDPEYVPSPGKQTYALVNGWREFERADAAVTGVSAIVGTAQNAGLLAAGFAEDHKQAHAVGTRNGAFGFYRATRAVVSTTHRTPAGDGSGWAKDVALRPEEIDWAGVGRRATDKAERSVGATPLKPGAYLTIFEPSAVADLANLLRWGLDARRTDEGRSFLSKPGGGNRLGERLFPSWMLMMSNPTDPRMPGPVFTDEGRPNMPTLWVQQGAITRQPCSSFWATKQNSGFQAPPSNWLMSGGTGTVDDLIAKTERGVLVTSLWYIRSLDPRQLLYTGLTRDGLFWIEDGKIARPLSNMRWNDSPLSAFGKALDASQPVPAAGRSGPSDTVVPAIRTAQFHFTSASEAI